MHPTWLHAGTEVATIDFILRDHDADRLAEHEALLRELVDDLAASEPRASVAIEVRESVPQHEALRRRRPADRRERRGGDAARRACPSAARSSAAAPTAASCRRRGLPTPNLFTGGHDYHSVREWASLQEMGAAAATIVHLVQVWAEDGAGGQPTRAAASSGA